MIVVSDTSAITSLMQIGREEILRSLFSVVLIPVAVRDELLGFHEAIPNFLQVVTMPNYARVDELLELIDRGEAEAIILAEERKPDYLLIDDQAAREVAIAKGLPVIGLLGVLVKAKKAGILDSLLRVIHDLEEVAGFRISPELKAKVLVAGGE